MKFNIKTFFLIAAVVMGINGVSFAQVKIGLNPTTIGANSNLEVEATTNSKKVIVHKNDGTVVIENIPVGATTDKIVTTDISGNIRSLTTADLISLLGLSGSGSMASSTPQSLSAGGYHQVDFTTIVNDPYGSIDLTNDEFVVKIAGAYTFNATLKVTIPGVIGERANVDVFIQKQSSLSAPFVTLASAQQEQNATLDDYITVSVTNNFAVGDRIRIVVNPCIGCIAGTSPPAFTLKEVTFFGTKLL